MKIQKVTVKNKRKLIAEIKQAVKEIKLIKVGKKSARDADEFLNELKH